MDSTNYSSDEQSPSTSAGRPSYADVVKGYLSAPITNSYWRKFQAEDEEEAVKKALEASLKDCIVSFSVVQKWSKKWSKK